MGSAERQPDYDYVPVKRNKRNTQRFFSKEDMEFIEREFITEKVKGTPLVPSKMAEKYGITETRINRWANRYNWNQKVMLEATAQKYAEAMAMKQDDVVHDGEHIEKPQDKNVALGPPIRLGYQELVDFNAADFRMAKLIRTMVAAILSDSLKEARKMTLSDLGLAVRIVSEAQKIGRLAIGASTDNHLVAMAEHKAAEIASIPVEQYELALKRALDEY